MTTGSAELGRRGEARAARWYRRRGYRVLALNWADDAGEIDLVVRRGRRLVFCEVKSRATPRHGSPIEAVDAGKQRRVRAAARRFLAAHDLVGVAHRFDVAEVLAGRVSVRPGVF